MPRGSLDQLVQDRQQKRRRLAAAGHRAGEQIAPFERRRNGVRLDGRRPGEPEILEAAEQIRVKLETGEWHCGDLPRAAVSDRAGIAGRASAAR